MYVYIYIICICIEAHGMNDINVRLVPHRTINLGAALILFPLKSHPQEAHLAASSVRTTSDDGQEERGCVFSLTDSIQTVLQVRPLP
jgi:hypothetical protein